jgi:hypothetical protein
MLSFPRYFSFLILYDFARAVKCFSNGNGWVSSETRTLEGWTKFFGETVEFYLYDNPEELFLWLSRE